MKKGQAAQRGMNGDRKALWEEIDQAVPPFKIWHDRARRGDRGEFGNLSEKWNTDLPQKYGRKEP